VGQICLGGGVLLAPWVVASRTLLGSRLWAGLAYSVAGSSIAEKSQLHNNCATGGRAWTTASHPRASAILGFSPRSQSGGPCSTGLPPRKPPSATATALPGGRLRIGAEGKQFVLEAGGVIEIPAGTRHTAEVVGGEAVVSLDATRSGR
jgi:hypothetical protein